jgi:hypothetical protein
VIAPVSGGEYLSAGAACAKSVDDWRETVQQEAREGLMFASALVQMMLTTKMRCAGRELDREREVCRQSRETRVRGDG